ncbi:MAG: hypothetical protein RIR18_1324 [Pseudomonadota bacterium]|jgi:thiamine biosynthesis lipoprotein
MAQKPERFTFDAMGTACTLYLYAHSASVAKSIAEQVISEIERIEEKYSRYIPTSTLSKINYAGRVGGAIDVDAETATLLDYAWTAHRISGGLFDITTGVLRNVWNFDSGKLPSANELSSCLLCVGMEKLIWENPTLRFSKPGVEIDFGGIGKEYAADRALDACLEQNITHGLIDLGGDIRVIGPHPDGVPWKVSIRDPRNLTISAQDVFLYTGALATSGDYERYMEIEGQRYCHILNPRTGMPATGLRSATIQADHCLFAGTIASIAMLEGKDAIGWLNEQGISYFCIDNLGQEHCSMQLAPIE